MSEVLSVYREFLPEAPRDLNGFFAFHTVPPAPPFPEEIHLRKVCGVVWCYVGPEKPAPKAMAPLLDSLPQPLMHGVAPMPHAALQGAFDGLYPAGDQWYWPAWRCPRRRADRDAWGYRDATWGSVFAGVDPDPANADEIRRWSVEYFEELHPFSAGGAYVNMMMDEGEDRVRASYRDNYDPLARIKAVYDPDNLFRVNQNRT